MLEQGLNQGAGLHRITPRAPLRLVAMASHGDHESELPLLWNLCSTWIGLGYPVAVLDVTAKESEDNPGLQQLLDGTFWNEGATRGTRWAILPAARGMQRWRRAHADDEASALGWLAELLPQFEVVLLYARTDMIATLLRGSGVMPLVALSPQMETLLTAYQSTKQLLLNAGLEPTIVSVVGAADAPTSSSQQLSKNLQDCAMNFLGHRLTTLTAESVPADRPALDALKRLALRLLEHAALMPRGGPVPAPVPPRMQEVDAPSRAGAGSH